MSANLFMRNPETVDNPSLFIYSDVYLSPVASACYSDIQFDYKLCMCDHMTLNIKSCIFINASQYMAKFCLLTTDASCRISLSYLDIFWLFNIPPPLIFYKTFVHILS